MPGETWENKRVTVDDALLESGQPHEVTEPVWWTGDIYGSEETYNQSLSSFSRPQVLVFAALWYLGEVNNGGHDQFYFNSTGIVWKDALDAFSAFGLNEVVEIIEESTRRFPSPPSLVREERQAALASSEPDFDDLDSQLYELQEHRDFDALMMDFVRKNRDAFYFDGTVSIPQ